MSSTWYDIEIVKDTLRNQLETTSINDPVALDSLHDTCLVLNLVSDLTKEAQYLMDGEITVSTYNRRIAELQFVHGPALNLDK